MIDVINKISVKDTIFNSSTLNYMKAVKLKFGPEDVYFSINMQKYNIGVVADWDSARDFSTETVYNKNSLGGHNFWMCDKNWKDRLYSDVIIQFKPMFIINGLEHRGGWKYVLNYLNDNDFYNNNSKIYFYDVIENYFMFSDKHVIGRKWAGVLHCTPIAPPYLDIVNIQNLFSKKKFLDSLQDCIFILTLSTYIMNYLKKEFLKLNIYVDVFMIKHPVVSDNIIQFNLKNYIKNSNKYLIQIGQQLRKMTSIFLINPINNYKKLWLSGTKNFEKCKYLLNEEIKYLNIRDIEIDTILFYYTETFKEYDELLSKNIVFIELFDAAANNTVLECIIRNTPIIVNKLEGVVEYLGENYPLYFNNLDDIKNLVTTQKIIEGYYYLKNMNKEDLHVEYFVKNIITNATRLNKSILTDFKPDQKLFCAHTPYGLGLGGGEKFILDIARYFIMFKNTYVIIFTNENQDIIEKTIEKILHKNFISLIKVLPENEIKNWVGKIDYFFSMCNTKLPIIEGMANKIENNIFHCQFPFDLNLNYEKNTLSAYKNIIVNSDYTKYFYLKFTNKYITNQNTNIIYPICFDKINIYESYNKEPNSFVMIGRIFSYNPNANNKNFDIALKYFEKIETIGGDYKLYIIGQNYSNSFLDYLKSFNCKNVEFHINASEQDKKNILSKSQYIINMVGINRSLDYECYAYEHFGISILEGINYCCIPISINGGFPSCYITHEISGLIFYSEKDFYDIIYNIIINKKSHHFNYDYYDKFLEKFTLESYNNSLDELFINIY